MAKSNHNDSMPPPELDRFLRLGSFTPYVTSGTQHSCCCRSLLGLENPMQACPCSFFPLPTLQADVSLITTAQRYRDAVLTLRRDIANVCSNALFSTKQELAEVRAKLQECDANATRLTEIKSNRDAWKKYNDASADYERLQPELQGMQREANVSQRELRRLQHKLERLLFRQGELERMIQTRQANQQLRQENRARRQQERGNNNNNLEQELLPPARQGRGLRRLQEVDLPNVTREINAVESEVGRLERVVMEYQQSKERAEQLCNIISKEPPQMDCSDEQQRRDDLEQTRNQLLELHPRLFRYLFHNQSDTRHLKSFDDLYRSLQSGQCPSCQQPLVNHQVLFSSFKSVSETLEDQLHKFLESSRSSTSTTESGLLLNNEVAQ